MSVPSQPGVKRKPNKHKVSGHRIPTPSDRQLEVLTQLRQAASHRGHIFQQLLWEACQIMEAVSLIIDTYANDGVAPSEDILLAVEEWIMSLVEDMDAVLDEELFYRDLQAHIFASIGQ